MVLADKVFRLSSQTSVLLFYYITLYIVFYRATALLFSLSTNDKLPVYNSSSVRKSVTNNKLMQLSVKYFMLHPFDEILWRPRILITGSKFIYHAFTVLQQVLPAMFIDFIMKTTGKPQTM